MKPVVAWDSRTQGNWIGSYGGQGYGVVGSGTQYPAYATVTVTGATTAVLASGTTDQRCLQTVGGNGRIAADWFAPNSFTVGVNLSDGTPHNVAALLSRLERLIEE